MAAGQRTTLRVLKERDVSTTTDYFVCEDYFASPAAETDEDIVTEVEKNIPWYYDLTPSSSTCSSSGSDSGVTGSSFLSGIVGKKNITWDYHLNRSTSRRSSAGSGSCVSPTGSSLLGEIRGYGPLDIDQSDGSLSECSSVRSNWSIWKSDNSVELSWPEGLSCSPGDESISGDEFHSSEDLWFASVGCSSVRQNESSGSEGYEDAVSDLNYAFVEPGEQEVVVQDDSVSDTAEATPDVYTKIQDKAEMEAFEDELIRLIILNKGTTSTTVGDNDSCLGFALPKTLPTPIAKPFHEVFLRTFPPSPEPAMKAFMPNAYYRQMVHFNPAAPPPWVRPAVYYNSPPPPYRPQRNPPSVYVPGHGEVLPGQGAFLTSPVLNQYYM